MWTECQTKAYSERQPEPFSPMKDCAKDPAKESLPPHNLSMLWDFLSNLRQGRVFCPIAAAIKCDVEEIPVHSGRGMALR